MSCKSASVQCSGGVNVEIRNEEIRHRLQQRLIIDVVRDMRESWRVKVMKKPESLVGKAMTGEVKGRQPRGRPRER